MKFNDYILVENLEVAKTILGQLGGNRFIAMTGAKNFIGDTNSVSFKIGRNSTQANGVKITLNSSDLYDMQFIQASKNGIKILKVYNDLYNDQLRKVFTQFTGMHTSLFGESFEDEHGIGKSPKNTHEKCKKCGKAITIPVEKAGDALCGKCKDAIKTGYGNEEE